MNVYSFYDASGQYRASMTCDQETADRNLALHPGWHRFVNVDSPRGKMVVDGALVDKPADPVATETLAEAKERRIKQIKSEGVALARQRFEAIRDFDMLRLVQQIIASMAPAARQPTADITWLGQVWNAGGNGVAAVKAATTVSQVDAVVVSWPSP